MLFTRVSRKLVECHGGSKTRPHVSELPVAWPGHPGLYSGRVTSILLRAVGRAIRSLSAILGWPSVEF